MMKGFVVTQKGAEKISLQEIDELISSRGTADDCVAVFDCDAKKLCDLCYHGRSFIRVAELLCSFEFKDLNDLSKKIKLGDFSSKTFAVECIREGNHDFLSTDVERVVGEKVEGNVDLKNPQKIFFAYIHGNRFYLGVDYSGFDMGKRSYKIFPHPNSLRGDVAYTLLRIAGYSGKGVLADPFCGSGTIAIEAALFSSGRSVHFYEKDRFAFLKFMKYDFKDKLKEAKDIFGLDFSQNAIIAARKNAKIAGVAPEFTKAGVDWLDTKFGEKSVDFIVTNPPLISKRKSPEKTKKAYEEFFHNASYVINLKGAIVSVAKDKNILKNTASKEGLRLEKEINLPSFDVLVFVR